MTIRDDERVVLDHTEAYGADYGGKRLKQFCTVGSRLRNCNFAKIRIQDAQFGAGREVSEFIDCNFNGARLEHISGGPSRFVRCSFKDVGLEGWFAHEVELIECVFTGRLKRSVFNGRPREEMRPFVGRNSNEFRGNDFSGMEFVDVGFRNGIDLSLQQLPSGPDYLYLPDAPAAVERARSALLGWQDLEVRTGALRILKSLLGELEGGQQQLLLRKSDFSIYEKPTRRDLEVLFALLQREPASGAP